MIKFSTRLKELRSSRQLTQEQLANLLKLSKSSINMYERGEREPSMENTEAIADLFNVDLDYLYGRTDIANKALHNAILVGNAGTGKSTLMKSLSSQLLNIEENLEFYQMYDQLDTEDKAEVRGEVKQMLKSPKYSDNPKPKPKVHHTTLDLEDDITRYAAYGGDIGDDDDETYHT